jgi:hypothetical protein
MEETTLFIDMLKPLFSNFFGPILAVIITNWYAIKKLRKELSQNVQKEKYTRILDACQGCWKLLAFTTDTENKKSVLLWTQDYKTKEKTYYIHLQNAQEYIDTLATLFYGEGKGLFLPATLKPLLFEYRSILYGVLLSTKNTTEEKVVVKKSEMVKRMVEIHQELVKILRSEMQMDDPKLPKTMQ